MTTCNSIDRSFPSGPSCVLASGHRGKCTNRVTPEAEWWDTGLYADSPELPHLIEESQVPEEDLAACDLARAIAQMRQYRAQRAA